MEPEMVKYISHVHDTRWDDPRCRQLSAPVDNCPRTAPPFAGRACRHTHVRGPRMRIRTHT